MAIGIGTATLISSLVGALGGLGMAGASYGANKNLLNEQMQFNEEQASINREWQTQMANTSYQRGAEDLRNAGLNPFLAYTQGGASMPSSSPATTSGAGGLNFGNPFKGFNVGVQPGVDHESDFNTALKDYIDIYKMKEKSEFYAERHPEFNRIISSALNTARNAYIHSARNYNDYLKNTKRG